MEYTGFKVKDGEYGKSLFVTSKGSQATETYKLENQIKELILNYTSGWKGNTSS